MTTATLPQPLERRLPAVNDRLLTTCFLAALLHGIIILGVGFSAPPTDPRADRAPALEVVLVGEQPVPLKRNRHAKYLSQRNQRGVGNSTSRDPASVPRSSTLPIDRPGFRDAEGDRLAQSGSADAAARALVTQAPSARILYYAQPQQAASRAQSPELLEDRPNLELAANSDGTELRLRGDASHTLWVTADTRESGIAVYLDAWRRKVERIGTINFPTVARQTTFTGTPIVEVELAADGKLAAATIRRSSGNPEIDHAALAILRLASPFDPFPRSVSLTHDEIRFAYEWQFLHGSPGGSGVFLESSADPDAQRP